MLAGEKGLSSWRWASEWAAGKLCRGPLASELGGQHFVFKGSGSPHPRIFGFLWGLGIFSLSLACQKLGFAKALSQSPREGPQAPPLVMGFFRCVVRGANSHS